MRKVTGRGNLENPKQVCQAQAWAKLII